MTFARELWQFARTRKKLILIPLILVLVAVGVLLFLAETSAVTPFIYTLF